jgi:two-component system NarL family sensor kinase
VKLETELFLISDGAHPSPNPICHSEGAASPLEALQSAAVAGTMQQLIDDLPEQIALLDISGIILVANRAWKKIVQDYDYLDALPGHNYRTFCVNKAAEGYEPAAHAVAAIDDIASGKRSYWQLMYNGRERWSHRDFQICMHRIEVGTQSFISVTRFDLTEIVELRRVRDDFKDSLVEGQAVERQRMARELHDSTSQLLTAVSLLLGRLKHEAPNEKSLGLVEELQGLVRETHQEIRSIAYIAQPSAVEQNGLTAALKGLVEGLGRRTGLEASFQIEGDAVPIAEAAQGALYRIAQEALSNVHRHARATRVRIILSFRGLATHLVIADDGIGIPPETAAGAGSAGVGLASMRSRLSEIGGRLTLQSLSPGTAVIASVGCDGSRLTGEQPLPEPAFVAQPTQRIA